MSGASEMELREIQLSLSAEEFKVLRIILDFHDLNDEPGQYYPYEPFTSLHTKVVEIGKRLDFFEKKGKP